MELLATLHQLRRRLGLAANDTAEDAQLLSALQTATAQIESATGRHFTPHKATLHHTITHPDELLLQDDLLQLDSLTNGDGHSIDLMHVMTLPESRFGSAASILRLMHGQAFVWYDSPLGAVAITGIWGWHDRWLRAWRESGATLQQSLDATTISATVSDAAGADGYTQAPRFQVGQLLRIEAEYLHVLAVNPTDNTIKLARAVNGTDASAHTLNTPIDIYQPPLTVESLCLRWAHWLYREADNGRTFAALPLSLATALDQLRRISVRA